MRLTGNLTGAEVIGGICAVSRITAATLKVLIVTGGSIFAVVFASLIISIIQFQLRLNEARIQNGNITLESVQLIADYQDDVSKHYKQLRARDEELHALRIDYQAKLNSTTQLMANLCAALAPKKVNECYLRLQALVNNNNSQFDPVVTQYAPADADALKAGVIPVYISTLRDIVVSGALQKAHARFIETQNFIEAECQRLTQSVSSILGTSSLLTIPPELRMTIFVQCYPGKAGEFDSNSPVNVTPVSTTGAGTDQSAPQQNTRSADDVSGVNRVLLSELVFYYKFYDWLTSFAGANLRQIILSPPEFIVIILVIATGILGSFLFHTYTMFRAESMDGFPSFYSIGLRATLSVMCALVIYILSRTGFVAITEGGARSAEVVISPFVIAFVSVASGLMAEKALERIRAIGDKALQGKAVAGGGRAPTGRAASQGGDQQ